MRPLSGVVQELRGAPPGDLPGSVGREAGQDAYLTVIEHGPLRRRVTRLAFRLNAHDHGVRRTN